MIATQPFVASGIAAHGRKLRVVMAESEPAQISKLLRSLFPEEEALELTLLSTVSLLLPTIQLVGPEVLFPDLSACGPDALATVRAGTEVAAANTPTQGAPAGPEPRGSELVLIAEDHESIREMVRQTL